MQNESIELLKNPWNNVYWFARMLLNSDQYASIGKETNRLITMGAEIIAIVHENSAEDFFPNLYACIRNNLLKNKKEGTKVRSSIENFITDLQKLILAKEDAYVFAVTCTKIISISNLALNSVPSDDKAFTAKIGKSILDEQGVVGLKTLINTWDNLGVRGCLEAERMQVIHAYQHLKKELLAFEDMDEISMDLTLTACVQEMERRLGQKRKGRGGRSLEDVTSLILDHFNFKSCFAPAHFQADIEVDKWIMTKRKFYIGISCKRTLRERWKQVSSADIASMGRYKIAAFFHVITYSKDLSDDKLSLLGGYGHIFYLPDDDPTLQRHSQHRQLSKYVRPMSGFANDLQNMIETN